MAFIGGIVKNFIKPLAQTAIRAIAPQAAGILKGVAGNVISDLFSKGTGAVQGLLSKIPFVGPMASNLVGKYAPQLQNLATNFFNGGVDKLLTAVTGQPTSRPVPGTNQSVTTPSIASEPRTTSIIQNTPSSSSSASTATQAASNSSGGPSYNGSFPSYPTPPKDPKDLAGQNDFQSKMFDFQQASQNMNTFWQMMQNTLKSMGDTANNAVRNLR
jgi:hypothetical protein